MKIKSINLGNLTAAGDDLLCYNRSLTEVSLKKLSAAGNDFLFCNESLRKQTQLSLLGKA